MASPLFRYHTTHSGPNTPRTFASTSTSTGGEDPYIQQQQQYSVSETRPFDWAAARGERPAPYGASPAAQLGARRRAQKTATSGDSVRPKLVRKSSWWTRMINYPAQIWFDISLLPETLPLPPPKVLGRAIGAVLHLTHWWVCWMDLPVRAADDLGDDWGDMRSEIRGGGISSGLDRDDRFDWSWFLGWFLVIASFANVLWMFTRFRAYHLHMKTDKLTSPNAQIVKKDLNLEYKPNPPLTQWIAMLLGRQIRESFRFLIGSTVNEGDLADRLANVQRLDVWFPGELGMGLFTVYNPIHAILYPTWSRETWIRVPFIMLSLTATLYALVSWYDQLIKDRATIAAEVMHEYDQGFVYPLINPLRRDACVQTNEAEYVDYHPSPARNNVRQARVSLAQPKSWQQLQNERHANGSPRSSAQRNSVGGGGLLRF